jgi:hypothetical protein
MLSLEQKIMADLKVAMLAKDEAALRSLRAIKAAILLAKTAEGATGELTQDAEIKLLQKMVKQRKDSLEIFQQQSRPELAQKEDRGDRRDRKVSACPTRRGELASPHLPRSWLVSALLHPPIWERQWGLPIRSWPVRPMAKPLLLLSKRLLTPA